jgi:hypothetical protein
MQKKLVLVFILLLMTALVGCSSNDKKNMKLVSKVGIEQIISGGDIIEAISYPEEHIVNAIKEVIEKINWDKNLKKTHSKRYDVNLILYFNNADGHLMGKEDYSIWYEDDETATVHGPNEYGKLDKETTNSLKQILANKDK